MLKTVNKKESYKRFLPISTNIKNSKTAFVYSSLLTFIPNKQILNNNNLILNLV